MIPAFENVTIYRVGMFGVGATACKGVVVETGVHYAQYTNAVRVKYLEKGKRLWRSFILDYDPWLRVVPSKSAPVPTSPLDKRSDGSSVSRYSSYDPRYVTDFEDQLAASQAPVLLAIGEGKREKCMRCVERIATTEESGSLVCGLCASAIRAENNFSASDTEALESL